MMIFQVAIYVCQGLGVLKVNTAFENRKITKIKSSFGNIIFELYVFKLPILELLALNLTAY